MASFIIADETSRARVVLWNDQTDLLKDIKEGTIVKITNGFSKENNGNIEIHTASKSELEVNPAGIKKNLHPYQSKSLYITRQKTYNYCLYGVCRVIKMPGALMKKVEK